MFRVFFIIFVFLPFAAYAQGANQNSSVSLDGIIVDAPQDNSSVSWDGSQTSLTAPGTVTVINRQELEQQNIRDLRQLSSLTSNMTSFDGGGNRMTQLSIRGVREQSYQSAPEILPNVSYYVDDVPALSILGRVSIFNNVDRVILKKGPQNGNYGFSRSGGVIDIRTADPTDKLKLYGQASYGNYNAYEMAAGFSSPLVRQMLYLSMDVIKSKRDGFYDNTALNDSYGDKDALGGRVKLTARPSHNVTVDVTVQHERFRDQADPYISNPLTNPDPFKVNFDRPGFENITQNLQSLRIRSTHDTYNFMSVTAHRHSKWNYSADAIQFGAFFADFIGTTDEIIETFTQEFRISSKRADTKLNWSGGLFFSHSKMDFVGGFFANDGTPAGPPTIAETISRDVAGFGELSIPLMQNVKLLAGLRYDWAHREGSNQFSPPSITTGKREFGELLPSVSVIYSNKSNTSYFAKYSRGYKPGGFNARTSASNPFEFEYESETSDNFEIGAKSRLLNGKLALNASLFYTQFKDYHNLTYFTLNTFGIRNASKARSYGAELEAKYYVLPALQLFANLGTTNAKYERFEAAFGDFSGNKISYTPEYTATYGVKYSHSSGLYMMAQARTIGSYFLDDANAGKQKSYTLIDLTAGYRWRNLDASVFVKNLTDEQYVINSLNQSASGSPIGSIGDPMTVGVKIRAEL